MSLNRQEQLMLEHMIHDVIIIIMNTNSKYNNVRPQSIVSDLRKKGYNIVTEMKYKTRRDGSHTKWAFYRLES